MKRITLRLYWGDTVTLHRFENGHYACPVCGAVIAHPPYAYDDGIDPDNPPKESFATASHYVCACCETQFGDDDFSDHGKETTEALWAELRKQWLLTTKDKTKAALQLKNISIET